jgi:uncharacterized protein YjeT (DUF2065 family)
MPPLQALAALHGFWAMVALAAFVQAFHRLRPNQLRHLGLVSTVVGAVALLVFISYDLFHWLGPAPDQLRRYIPQRLLFFLGTYTDVPLVQLTAAGMICWIAGIKKCNTKDAAPPSVWQPGGASVDRRPDGSAVVQENLDPHLLS